MRWFTFSYFNFKNLPEDAYEKKYNEAYQNNKKDYFRYLIHWNWNIPHIPFEGIEIGHIWDRSYIVFCGTDNLYWLHFRISPRYDQKGKWKLKISKNTNDHCCC